MTMDLKTPLYDCHVALEGRMVPFAGYVLPVQYPTGVIREHCDVYLDGKKIGVTTSGTHCPYLGKAVAMALIDGPAEDGALTVDVRGRQIEAKFIPLPFYQRKK